MTSPADKLRRAQSMTMPEDLDRGRSPASPGADPALLAELSRLRTATERMERRQRFSWGRVLALLVLLLIITFLLI